jgi:hypothetical protein
LVGVVKGERGKEGQRGKEEGERAKEGETETGRPRKTGGEGTDRAMNTRKTRLIKWLFIITRGKIEGERREKEPGTDGCKVERRRDRWCKFGASLVQERYEREGKGEKP